MILLFKYRFLGFLTCIFVATLFFASISKSRASSATEPARSSRCMAALHDYLGISNYIDLFKIAFGRTPQGARDKGIEFFIDLFRPVLGFHKINKLYDDAMVRVRTERIDFYTALLKELEINLVIKNQEFLDNLPKDRPVIFVTTHQNGGFDVLAPMSISMNLLGEENTKFLAIEMVSDLAPVAAQHIPAYPKNLVSDYPSQEALDQIARGEIPTIDETKHPKDKLNGKQLPFIREHMENGGNLALFPGAHISHFHPETRQHFEYNWNRYPLFASLAKKFDAVIVPLRVNAQSSRAFRWADRHFVGGKKAFQGWELLAKRGSDVTVEVLSPITKEDLPALGNNIKEQAEAIQRRVMGFDP